MALKNQNCRLTCIGVFGVEQRCVSTLYCCGFAARETLALLNFLHTPCTCYCNANMLSGQEHFILLLRKGCWVGRAVVDFLGGNKGKSDIRASPHRRRSFGSKEEDQAHERHTWATRALTRTRELGRNTRRLGNVLPRVVSVSIAARFESNRAQSTNSILVRNSPNTGL